MAKKKAEPQKAVQAVQKLSKHEIEEMLEEGALHARCLLTMVGKPKQHIESTLKKFVESLASIQNAGFYIIKESYKPAELEEGSDSLYSVFCEVEVICDSIGSLMAFSMEAMPSSVEIVEPEQFDMNVAELNGLMNDFAARLHTVDMIAKKANQQAKLLAQSVGILLQNSSLILLNLGPREKVEMAKIIGVNEKQMDPVLQKLITDGKIVMNGKKYSLAPKPK